MLDLSQPVNSTMQSNYTRENLYKLFLTWVFIHLDAFRYLVRPMGSTVYTFNPFSSQLISKLLHNLKICLEQNHRVFAIPQRVMAREYRHDGAKNFDSD